MLRRSRSPKNEEPASPPSSPTASSSQPFSLQRALRHALQVCIKMALFRLAFGLVKQLFIKGNIVRGLPKILNSFETEIVSSNPLKWALFGGTMALYRPVQQGIETALMAILPVPPPSAKQSNANDENTGETSSTTAVRLTSALLAGGLVSLPTLRVFNLTTRTELTLYVTVRAIHAICSELLYPTLVPTAIQERVPTQAFNVAAMSVVSAVLLGCSTFHPEAHSTEYRNFLVHATTFEKPQMQSLACCYGDQLSPQVVDYCARNGLDDVLGNVITLPDGRRTLPTQQLCRILHPKYSSCTVANLDHIARHMLRVSIPLYGPLKIITTLMKGPKRILKDPVGTAAYIGKSTFTSSLFLTLYVCTSYRIVCLMNQAGSKSQLLVSALCGVAAGLTLLLEPVDRQVDLILFCSMHGLRSTVLLLSKLGKIARPSRTTVAVAHTVAWAIMFAMFEMRRQSLRGMFASMLGFFVGGGGSGEKNGKKQIEGRQQPQQEAVVQQQ